jgi:hypothetical protein
MGPQRFSAPTGGRAGAGASRIRASTMTAPLGPATTGLQSSSAMAGWAGERGHPLDDVLHRSGVGERRAAEPVEEGERAQLAQHGGRFAWTDRGQANLHVADQLRGRAGGTDGDGPKRGSPTTPPISSGPGDAILCTRNRSGATPAAFSDACISRAARSAPAAVRPRRTAPRWTCAWASTPTSVMSSTGRWGRRWGIAGGGADAGRLVHRGHAVRDLRRVASRYPRCAISSCSPPPSTPTARSTVSG